MRVNQIGSSPKLISMLLADRILAYSFVDDVLKVDLCISLVLH